MTCRQHANQTAKIIFFCCSFISLLPFALLVFAKDTDAGTEFPHPPFIKKNVRFWEDVYSSYSLNEAVIHDSDDLSIVYEIIPLLDNAIPGAQNRNSSTEKRARKKYSSILKKLSKNKPANNEEKRIAALFSGVSSQKKIAAAARKIRSQRGVRERFSQGVIRSGAYLPEMRKIFRSYGLPEDLVYLPHVESSFNTRAYSKFGAAGIWQITRSTGKQYLKIDLTLDERLDPILATHAAAKYLKNSYRLLDNWPHAITSYNYGTSGMMRAVKAEGSYENIFRRYSKGHFKFASKNFYPEFLAALKVAKILEKKLRGRLDRPQSGMYFELPNYIHIDYVVRHFHTTSATIRKLNPALRPPVFTGEKLLPKGYQLRLPMNQYSKSRIRSLPSSFFKKKQKSSPFHRVKKGDTASSIAKQHKITLKELMTANNLDNDATIYLRQKLRISSRKSQQIASTVSGTPLIKARTKRKFTPDTANASVPLLLAKSKTSHQVKPKTFVPKQNPAVYSVTKRYLRQNIQYGHIIIQPEETIQLYAQWLGTSVKELINLNKLPYGANGSPGQSLLLLFQTMPIGIFEDKRLDYLQETEEEFFSAYKIVGKKNYRVLPGDTLWDLCHNKFDIPLWLLHRYNSTINLIQLHNDQELIIPLVRQI